MNGESRYGFLPPPISKILTELFLKMTVFNVESKSNQDFSTNASEGFLIAFNYLFRKNIIS